MLDLIHEGHPDAIFILNMRHPTHWVSSVLRWVNLPYRLAMCGKDETQALPVGEVEWFGAETSSAQDLEDWYCEHVARIRQFVADHPSHVLVEVDIENQGTGDRLSDLFVGRRSLDNEDESLYGDGSTSDQTLVPWTKATSALNSSFFWGKVNANEYAPAEDEN